MAMNAYTLLIRESLTFYTFYHHNDEGQVEKENSLEGAYNSQ